MTYICPDCKRTLLGPNQYHSCYITDKETHLQKMSPDISELFEVLLSYLITFENIEIIYLKTCIQFKIGATFLSVYTKKNHLELEFQLHREEDQFPIYHCKRISRNRVLHRLAIGEVSEFDQQLKNWLKEAYQTIKK
jgi:predicted transport protein